MITCYQHNCDVDMQLLSKTFTADKVLDVGGSGLSWFALDTVTLSTAISTSI